MIKDLHPPCCNIFIEEYIICISRDTEIFLRAKIWFIKKNSRTIHRGNQPFLYKYLDKVFVEIEISQVQGQGLLTKKIFEE